MALAQHTVIQIVEEYETHARIELGQILRLSAAGAFVQVQSLAHRLVGPSVNLGLKQCAERLKAIESQPQARIPNGAGLSDCLEKSIFWLKKHFENILHDIAG